MYFVLVIWQGIVCVLTGVCFTLNFPKNTKSTDITPSKINTGESSSFSIPFFCDLPQGDRSHTVRVRYLLGFFFTFSYFQVHTIPPQISSFRRLSWNFWNDLVRIPCFCETWTPSRLSERLDTFVLYSRHLIVWGPQCPEQSTTHSGKLRKSLFGRGTHLPSFESVVYTENFI